MNRIAKLTLVAVVALGLAATAAAHDPAVTLEGKVACAKCTLHKDDAKECQNVLLVPGADGKDVEYYVVHNEVDEKFGEVCTDVYPARVEGQVTEKDGRRWITPARMEKVKAKS